VRLSERCIVNEVQPEPFSLHCRFTPEDVALAVKPVGVAGQVKVSSSSLGSEEAYPL
jgi:hypothetical protein